MLLAMDTAVLTLDGMHREMAFVPSGPARLYASLYAGSPPRLASAFVIVPSWGVELGALQDLAHELAAELARLGGACVLYHAPGHGDSTGDPSALTPHELVRGAVDVAEWARSRASDWRWNLAGLRLGAAVAAMAASLTDEITAHPNPVMLLVQPALDPATYFREVETSATRAGARVDTGGLLFGHPRPAVQAWSEVTNEVASGLAGFPGRIGAVVFDGARHPSSASPSLPDRAERLPVDARWRPLLPRADRARAVQAAAAWVQAAQVER
jgi:hypothetical protein